MLCGMTLEEGKGGGAREWSLRHINLKSFDEGRCPMHIGRLVDTRGW